MSEKPAPKPAFEGVIDSVTGTIGLLWNMLSAPPEKGDVTEDILNFLPDSAEPKPDGQIPAKVVDTEGESEDA